MSSHIGLPELPQDLDILSCNPNPFKEELSINYHLAEESIIQLQIFDISGSKVIDRDILGVIVFL